MPQPETPSSVVVDRLSTLAPELLHSIFSLAHKRKKPAGPLNRSLRPFYDAVKFDKIVARGGRRIRSLLDTVTARPAFGSAVREVSLVDRTSATQLGTDDVQTLFELLPNLRVVSIRVSNSATCIEAVFPTRDDAETVLRPSIRVLNVVSSDAHGAGYDAKVLATLKHLPNLERVGLDFPSNTADEADTSMDGTSLPHIRDLRLGLYDESSTVGNFLARFPRLHVLKLQARGSTCNFSPALASVSSSSIREVCLGGHPPADWCFPQELAEFAALEKLALDGNFALVSLEAFRELGRVSLTTLRVAKDCDVSAEALAMLLGPRGFCPTLKVLKLDNLWGEYPPGLSPEDLVPASFDLRNYTGDADTAESLLDDFETPEWTKQFSQSAYEQLARAAELHGVTLKGSTVTAYEVDLVAQELESVVSEMREEEYEEARYYEARYGGYPGGRWSMHFGSFCDYDQDEDNSEDEDSEEDNISDENEDSNEVGDKAKKREKIAVEDSNKGKGNDEGEGDTGNSK